MISKYKEILKQVHYLANKRHLEYKKAVKNRADDSRIIDLMKVEEIDDTSGLLEYLKLQNMETIKVIQTVMYIGRDYIPETEDECIDRMEHNHNYPENFITSPQLESSNPDELLQSWLSDSRGVSEWEDIHLEIDQIYQKMPLDNYLERAFVILNIS